MGRRKIEIQPITHERNRSVTFLKRKNGLFKKAYELGVLCSVDVAVIIFEERPGHHVKLYQYCSADIQDMVQRHLRHDGEKDTRGPNDFSGNANHKADDDDNDDERDDDDDDDPRRLKRTRDGKMKPSSDMLDPYHRTSLPIPQPPQLPIHGSGQGHPISNDRGRLGGLHPHSRSPSDDPSNGPYPYVSSHNPAPFGGQGQYPTPRHNGSQYPFNFNNTPPSTFLPLQPDFPRGPTGTGSRGSGGGGGGGGYPLPPRSNSSGYEPGLYPGVMSSRSGPTHPPTSGGGSNDIFTAFLDSNDQRPGGAGSSGNASSQQGSSFVGLDWPVHNVPSAPGGGSTTSGNSSTGADPPNGGSSGSWIDYLSGPTNGGGGGGRESTMSWERGGGTSTDLGHRSGDLSSIFSGGGGGTGDRGRPGGMNGGSGLVMGISGKRRLVEDEVSGNGLLPSPISANGKS